MMATSAPRSSRDRGLNLGRVCIWALLSTRNTPTVSAFEIRKTWGDAAACYS